MELRIARTWDGEAAAPGEIAALRVSDAGEALRIEVDAPFHGDPPPDGPPGPTDRLWEHEVVELFVVGDGERYLEIELGPRGHHLVLQLDGVRRPVRTLLPIDYTAEVSADRWRGEARVPRSLLPPGPHRINAYAIHGAGPARRYLAMTPVPGPEPDFHRIHLFSPLVLP